MNTPTQQPDHAAPAAIERTRGREYPWLEWLEARNAWLVLGAAAGFVLAVCVLRALPRLLWFDELLTYAAARQGSLPELWAVLQSGMDAQPPLQAILAWPLLQLGFAPEMAVRLPAILAYALGSLLLGVVAWRRGSVTAGLLCTLYPLASNYGVLATEGRPYALLFALTAALYAVWAARRAMALRLVLLAVLSLLTSLTHFLAALPVGCLVLAQVLRAREGERRWYGGVLALVVPQGIGLWLLRGQIQAILPHARHYWSPPTIAGPIECLVYLLPGLGSLVMLGFLLRWHWRDGGELVLSRRVAMTLLALVPVMGWVLAYWVTNAFVARYYIPGLVGVTLWLGHIVRRSSPLTAIAAGLMVVEAVMTTAGVRSEASVHAANLRISNQVLARAERLDTVVYGLVNDYVEVAHYRPAAARNGYYLRDEAAAVRNIRVDTGDRLAGPISRQFPIRVVEYQPFVAAHREFWLILSDGARTQWVDRQLRRDGYKLQEVERDERFTLVRVTRP